MNRDALTHLTNDPDLTLALSRVNTTIESHAWYAAFRDHDSDEMTPERGYGYGPTPEAAIEAAVASFRANEDEAAR